MAIIAWKKVYETGIVALDKEHKDLVRQINTLYEAVRDKRGEDVIADIFAMLDSYTVDHFQHEERLMAEYQYPGLDEHRRHHQELNDAVAEMKNRTGIDPHERAVLLLRFLREWLMDHILAVDKKYGPYLESRGGRFID